MIHRFIQIYILLQKQREAEKIFKNESRSIKSGRRVDRQENRVDKKILVEAILSLV
jgi:hypothetical protein